MTIVRKRIASLLIEIGIVGFGYARNPEPTENREIRLGLISIRWAGGSLWEAAERELKESTDALMLALERLRKRDGGER